MKQQSTRSKHSLRRCAQYLNYPFTEWFKIVYILQSIYSVDVSCVVVQQFQAYSVQLNFDTYICIILSKDLYTLISCHLRPWPTHGDVRCYRKCTGVLHTIDYTVQINSIKILLNVIFILFGESHQMKSYIIIIICFILRSLKACALAEMKS